MIDSLLAKLLIALIVTLTSGAAPAVCGRLSVSTGTLAPWAPARPPRRFTRPTDRS